MITQLKFALKDIKNNISLVIIFIIQLSISSLFILLLSNQLIQDINSTKSFYTMYEKNYYSLKSYLNQSVPLSVSSDLDKLLTDTLDGNTNSYSSFTITIQDFNEETNVVVGLGGFGEINNLDKELKKQKGINVLIGDKVNKYQIGDNINIGTFSTSTLTINGKLSKGASYVDNNGLYNLDNSIVILSTWDEWKNFNQLDYIENIITNIKFIDSNKDDVEKFAQNLSLINKKYDLVPIDSNDILKYKTDTSNGQTVFLIFFISIVTMIGIGIFSNLMQLIDSNLREYSIHRLYGSTLRDIYIRITIYISTIITFTFIPMSFIFKEYPLEMIKYIPILFIILVIIIIFSIIIYPILKLKNHSITTFLRRDI